MVASLAQDGIRPHLMNLRYRASDSSAVMEQIRVEGAIFQDGVRLTSPDNLKCSASLAGFSFRAKRPHISKSQLGLPRNHIG